MGYSFFLLQQQQKKDGRNCSFASKTKARADFYKIFTMISEIYLLYNAQRLGTTGNIHFFCFPACLWSPPFSLVVSRSCSPFSSYEVIWIWLLSCCNTWESSIIYLIYIIFYQDQNVCIVIGKKKNSFW